MDNVKKRDRSVNFTREEVELLLSLVESKLQTIENKKSGAIAWHDKEKAWMAIEKIFNNSTVGIHRSARHLKAKYEALKRDTRKKACVIQGGHCNEGIRSGEVCLSEAEKKVFYMVQQANDGDFSEAEQICPLGVKRNRSMSSTEFVSTDMELTESFENNMNNEQNDDTCDSKCLSTIFGKDEHEDEYEENSQPKTTNSCTNKGTKMKRKIDQLIESVSDVVLLKKKVLEEEIKEKNILRKTHEEELQHRREMRALENQQMLLKIEILKAELEQGKKNSLVLNDSKS